MSKKIMVMSASIDGRLLTAVKTAKELGMETVAIVRLEDELSVPNADHCYAVDGEDTEQLLEIAKREKIDGVLGVFDKTALSAAIIADEMGLVGNSPECVRTLMEKGRFRNLQKNIGLFSPAHIESDQTEGLKEKCAGLTYPVIVKPVLCSSSFGQTRIEDERELIPAFRNAAEYSRNGAVCIEEFVEHDSLQILEAEVFLVGDEILWDGVYWCYRFPEAPLRPVLCVFPDTLDSRQEMVFKAAVKKALLASGARIGEFDIEGFFTEEGEFFIIEINPRPAGYYAQQDVQLFCGVDYTKLLVTTAVGDLSYYEELKHFQRQRQYLLSYAVFSFRPGVFDHVYIDPAIKEALLVFRAFPGGESGAYIEDIHADNRPVGMAVFGFSSEEEMNRVRDHIRELVYVVLRK